MLHLSRPVPMDDPLLMSDDERRAFLSPDPTTPARIVEIIPTRIGVSGYRGVNPTGSGRFYATIYHHGDRRYLGTFDTAADAARAYDANARELHGDQAILNFPDQEAA